MTQPALFQPLTLRDLTVRNRAWVPPMCQYAVDAQDGVPGAWHTVHYGSFAIGGFGLVIAEATGVTPEGRITPFDTGLWNDEQAAAWSSIVDFAHSQGAAMAVQLGHAGRKASTNRWWPGYPDRVLPPEEGGWRPVGVVDEDAADGLTEAGIEMVVDAFVEAARRADAAGFDAVEVHAAHGYLLHQFYSPLSNTRTDAWGGDHAGRTRLVRTVARKVRAAFPQGKPVLVRLSATDWVDGGWSIEDSVRLGAELRELGVDLVDVSSGGVAPASIAPGPGYQVDFAQRIRQETGMPTAAVGLITDPTHAEAIVANGRADAVLLGRAAMREPNWPLRAAHALGVRPEDAPYAPARWRSHYQR